MKAKLLRKLRDRVFIAKRNKEYKVIDVGNGIDDFYRESEWTSYKKAVKKRRNWILNHSNKLYKKPKKFLRN
jgi:hypothetical protein